MCLFVFSSLFCVAVAGSTIEEKLYEGKVFSVQWLSDTQLLTTGPEGSLVSPPNLVCCVQQAVQEKEPGQIRIATTTEKCCCVMCASCCTAEELTGLEQRQLLQKQILVCCKVDGLCCY